MHSPLFNSLMLMSMSTALMNVRFIEGVTREQYLGCYDEFIMHVMEIYDFLPAMTLDSCSELCKQRRTTFFGAGRFEMCFCADQYGSAVSDGRCDMPCEGNRSQICGSFRFLSVYLVCPIGYYGTNCSEVCHCLNDTRPGTAGAGCYFNGTCPAGCQTGWTGATCESDIDECDLSQPMHNCSHNCKNTIGSYTCSCRSGYTLNSDGRTCNDIDECALGSSSCQQNCTNTLGNYACYCRPGFSLGDDGRNCSACAAFYANNNNVSSCSSSKCPSGAVAAAVVLGIYGGLVTALFIVVLVKYIRLQSPKTNSQTSIDNNMIQNTVASIGAESPTASKPAESDLASYMTLGDVNNAPNTYEELKPKYESHG